MKRLSHLYHLDRIKLSGGPDAEELAVSDVKPIGSSLAVKVFCYEFRFTFHRGKGHYCIKRNVLNRGRCLSCAIIMLSRLADHFSG